MKYKQLILSLSLCSMLATGCETKKDDNYKEQFDVEPSEELFEENEKEPENHSFIFESLISDYANLHLGDTILSNTRSSSNVMQNKMSINGTIKKTAFDIFNNEYTNLDYNSEDDPFPFVNSRYSTYSGGTGDKDIPSKYKTSDWDVYSFENYLLNGECYYFCINELSNDENYLRLFNPNFLQKVEDLDNDKITVTDFVNSYGNYIVNSVGERVYLMTTASIQKSTNSLPLKPVSMLDGCTDEQIEATLNYSSIYFKVKADQKFEYYHDYVEYLKNVENKGKMLPSSVIEIESILPKKYNNAIRELSSYRYSLSI